MKNSKLIILRGNSGSGKTTIAKALQKKMGRETLLISQDIIRREMLWVNEFKENIYAYYFDLSFEETLKRHHTRPECNEFGQKEMLSWYNHVALPSKRKLLNIRLRVSFES